MPKWNFYQRAVLDMVVFSQRILTTLYYYWSWSFTKFSFCGRVSTHAANQYIQKISQRILVLFWPSWGTHQIPTFFHQGACNSHSAHLIVMVAHQQNECVGRLAPWTTSITTQGSFTPPMVLYAVQNWKQMWFVTGSFTRTYQTSKLPTEKSYF